MFRKIVWIMVLVLVVAIPVVAQDSCPAIVQQALEKAGEACSPTARNAACYGNGLIELAVQPDVAVSPFEAAGDTIPVTAIQSLTLGPLDATAGQWGVVMLSLQANLPDTLPGQNVTVLVFGDTELTPADDANISEAFYFRSGIGQLECSEAPNGMLIQTPKGEVKAELTVNNVTISMGSTAFITAAPGDNMVFNLIEGAATVTANDETVDVAPGQFTQIELDEDLNPVGAPSEPEDNEEDALPMLPTNVLPVSIDEVNGGNGDASGAAVDVVPLSGTWSITLNEIGTSAACPPGFAEAISQGMASVETSEMQFGGEMNFDDLMQGFGDQMPAGMTLENPEPGVFTWSLTDEGVAMNFEMRILSQTLISATFVMDMSASGINCQITIPYTYSYTGE